MRFFRGFEKSINPFNYWKKSFFGQEKKLKSFSLEMMGLGYEIDLGKMRINIFGNRCDRGHDILIQNLAKSLQSLIFLQNLSIRLDWY